MLTIKSKAMSNIKRRIEEVEKKLGAEQQVEPHVVRFEYVRADGSYIDLAEPIERWITYPRGTTAYQQIVWLSAEEELECRKRTGRTDLDCEGTDRTEGNLTTHFVMYDEKHRETSYKN